MLMSLLLMKFKKESKHEWTESRGFEHERDNTCWSLVLLLAYNNIRLILIEKEKNYAHRFAMETCFWLRDIEGYFSMSIYQGSPMCNANKVKSEKLQHMYEWNLKN